MEKYKDYLENKYHIWQIVIALLCAVVALVAIVVEMSIPVDSKEIESHYAQLELIKQDITKICELENADVKITSEGMTITLKGKKHNFKAYFDENSNHLNTVLEDNRAGSDLFLSIFLVFIGFVLGLTLTYALLALLYIPVVIHAIIIWAKRKKITRQNKSK